MHNKHRELKWRQVRTRWREEHKVGLSVAAVFVSLGIAALFASLPQPAVRWFDNAFFNEIVGVLIAGVGFNLFLRWINRTSDDLDRDASLKLGADGFVLNGVFVSWSNFESVEITSGSLFIQCRDGRSFTVAKPPKKLRIAERITNAYKEYAERPAIATGNNDIAQTASANHYRASRRQMLVRVATSPKASVEVRGRAITALADDPAALRQTEESLESLVDESTIEALRETLNNVKTS